MTARQEPPADVPTLVSATSLLRDPRDHERFMALSRRLARWLDEQPGFLRYELISAGNGWYLDTMLWQTWDHAQQGNAAFATSDLRAEFADIVEDYTTFMGIREQLS